MPRLAVSRNPARSPLWTGRGDEGRQAPSKALVAVEQSNIARLGRAAPGPERLDETVSVRGRPSIEARDERHHGGHVLATSRAGVR